ncbi:MAG: isopropylmalate isomerase [Gammaproteobacteria bacterium SG8_31]|jgi:3-isopropylmalate/(R)-2-methylmalate dehydratase small subunit|nr:MAG: isopropylmalate isomerase [Gammaproteobacteria bacterium SG8_31]
MEAIKVIRSRTVILPDTNVDTDQIIPARFLTTTSRHGLGAHLFTDRRFDAEGRPRPEFVLNTPEAADCRVLVAGHNFGCGSSREHAPWALMDYGIEAVISTGIADIFRTNALRNGLVAVVVDEAAHRSLTDAPGAEVAIDLHSCTVTLPDGATTEFEIEPFARYCLLEGMDPLGYLLSKDAEIRRYEEETAWTP